MTIKFAKPTRRNKLRAAMIASGFWTQQDLAREMGVSLPLISQVITGKLFPSNRFQLLCAAALGISLKEMRELL